MSKYSTLLLQQQLRDVCKHPVEGFSIGLVDDSNIYEWQVMIEGPSNTLFEGGLFPALLKFPKEYPEKPPTMTFMTPGFYHPNVYPDGRVCISILHEAKEDMFNQQEDISEKWRPILGIESILVSVVSMLADPNPDSPANVDASVEYKNDYPSYKRKVRRIVRKSLEML